MMKKHLLYFHIKRPHQVVSGKKWVMGDMEKLFVQSRFTQFQDAQDDQGDFDWVSLDLCLIPRKERC